MVFDLCKPAFSHVAIIYFFMPLEKASGVNLEAKSGAEVLEEVRVILTTSATSLEPVVLALAFPLD